MRCRRHAAGDVFVAGDWSVSRRVRVVQFGRTRLSLEALGCFAIKILCPSHLTLVW